MNARALMPPTILSQRGVGRTDSDTGTGGGIGGMATAEGAGAETGGARGAAMVGGGAWGALTTGAATTPVLKRVIIFLISSEEYPARVKASDNVSSGDSGVKPLILRSASAGEMSGFTGLV